MFREEVEEFFASMDRDFDGRLSFEEFMGEVAPDTITNLYYLYIYCIYYYYYYFIEILV